MKKIAKRGLENTVKDVVLRNLALTGTDQINDWFVRSYANQYNIPGIDEAAKMILEGHFEFVCIFGDYDADGVTATSQLLLTLRTLGIPVTYRIPHRFTEGFGLSEKAIDELEQDQNILCITVDNGITALDAVKKAKENGFTVIVTDHHLPSVDEEGHEMLPNADLIIDPNVTSLPSSDFTGYCGAGIAYKLCCALLDKAKEGTTDEKKLRLYDACKNMIQPLAAIGTVADVMDLIEENYVLVRNGLKRMAKNVCPPGLKILNELLYLTNPTSEDIAFKIGPCINSNGRLFDDGAKTSVELLTTMDKDEARSLAEKTIENNRQRKMLADKSGIQAENMILEKEKSTDLPIVLYVPDLNEGLLGILAAKVSETYKTVSMVFTDSTEKGVLKGSARSIPGVNLKLLLDEMQEYFVAYGGHEGAAGMTIEEGKLLQMEKASHTICSLHGYEHAKEEDILEYDLEISEDEVPSTLEELVKYAPFGNGNPAPVFKVTSYRCLPGANGKIVQPLGASGTTCKLVGEHSQALGFDQKEIFDTTSDQMTLYGTLSYNVFKGKSTPQVTFEHFESEEMTKHEETSLMALLRKANH